MTKWEYRTLNLNVEIKKQEGAGMFDCGYQDLLSGTDALLISLGEDGWELVSVMPIKAPGVANGTKNAVAFFKRSKA